MRIQLRNSICYGTVIATALLAGCGAGTTSDQGPARTARALAGTTIASTFGVTAASGYLTVDTGAGLVFKVKQAGGDITSIRYKGGPELQSQTKGSHIASGLGATVTYTADPSVVKITLTTSTLVHYLLVRQGDNTIYMGTYTTAEPSVGELRWITRLNGTLFTNVPAESNLDGTNGYIESQDVFGNGPDGTTRSKYYGNQRAMEMSIRGVTSPVAGVGAYMVYGSRETSSGGPFYRDIQNQSGTDTEVYNYMNSGHAQTEAWRMGFHGPYALVFNDGTATPAIPDMSWMEGQNLLGWVPATQRGKVVGRGLYGFDLTEQFTVGFANATAQYWATAKAPSGSFTTPAMMPGTYTMTVYKGELALYSESVTVGSGTTTTLPVRTLTGDLNKDNALWRIGKWDGTPLELMNGPNLNLMHPSDPRNASWGPTTYAVGAPANTFPAAQWKSGVNSPTYITFNLTPEQIAGHTIRIGITTAQAGGRPIIKVNNWSGPIQSASTQPTSRTLTVGNYRGNNKLYSVAVPASAFVVGTNTIKLDVVSGSSGDIWLSPAFVFDALDML